MRLRLLLAFALLLVGACVARNSKPEAPERSGTTFPHSTHVEADLSCRTCHDGIAGAAAIGPMTHVSLPSGDAAKRCLECHEGGPPPPPSRRIERTITFSHADHLSYVNGLCARCHTALAEPGQEKAPVPPMSVCTDCHNHALEYAQARCQPLPRGPEALPAEAGRRLQARGRLPAHPRPDGQGAGRHLCGVPRADLVRGVPRLRHAPREAGRAVAGEGRRRASSTAATTSRATRSTPPRTRRAAAAATAAPSARPATRSRASRRGRSRRRGAIRIPPAGTPAPSTAPPPGRAS